MGTYILIMVLASTSNSVAMGTINQEFSSFSTCKVAADKIVKQLSSSRYAASVGCYQK